MKMKSNLVAVVSLVTLMSVSFARAEGDAAIGTEVATGSESFVDYPMDEVVELIEVADIDVIPVDEEVVGDVVVTDVADSGDVTDGEATDGEKVVIEDDEVQVLPIDWIKRGNEDEDFRNPVICYFMAGGPAAGAVADGSSNSASRDLGQDDKVAEIEAKPNVAVPSVKGQKKGPVAVVKKGRIFLR